MRRFSGQQLAGVRRDGGPAAAAATGAPIVAPTGTAVSPPGNDSGLFGPSGSAAAAPTSSVLQMAASPAPACGACRCRCAACSSGLAPCCLASNSPLAASPGPAPDPLGEELAALRAARHEYAASVLRQDRQRNDLLASLADRLPLQSRPALGGSSRARASPPRITSTDHQHAGRCGGHQCCRSGGRVGRTGRCGRCGDRLSTPAARLHAFSGSSCSDTAEGGGEGDALSMGGSFSSGGAVPIQSWQRDLSRRLGGAIRKLQF